MTYERFLRIVNYEYKVRFFEKNVKNLKPIRHTENAKIDIIIWNRVFGYFRITSDESKVKIEK